MARQCTVRTDRPGSILSAKQSKIELFIEDTNRVAN